MAFMKKDNRKGRDGEKSKKCRRGRKGMIFMLDALLALTVFFLVLLLSLVVILPPDIPNPYQLKSLSHDMLLAAERQKLLDSTFLGNSTALRDGLRRLPPNVCMQIIVQDADGANETTISDPSCTAPGREIQTIWAPYYRDGQFYAVRVESWYR